MNQIPDCFYRVSIKALVLNETKDKFLIVQEEDGRWELPGGGLDWGMTPQEDLPREISEEMGLNIVSIAKYPSYFISYSGQKDEYWRANVLYETVLENLDFTASDECVALKFVNKSDLTGLNCFNNVSLLAEMFEPSNHSKA